MCGVSTLERAEPRLYFSELKEELQCQSLKKIPKALLHMAIQVSGNLTDTANVTFLPVPGVQKGEGRGPSVGSGCLVGHLT